MKRHHVESVTKEDYVALFVPTVQWESTLPLNTQNADFQKQHTGLCYQRQHIPRSCLPSSIFGIWTPSKFKYDELIKLIPSGAMPLTHILQLGSSLFWDSFRQKKELTIYCQQTHKTLQLNEKLPRSWLCWKYLIWLSK